MAGMLTSLAFTLLLQTPFPVANPCPAEADTRVATCVIPCPAPRAHGEFGTRTLTLRFDDDPYRDLAVSEPGSDDPTVSGRVWVFFGPTFDTWQLLELPSPQGDDRFGTSIAAGDLDADGLDELVVGAPRWNAGPLSKVGLVSIWKWTAGGPVEWMTLEPSIVQPGAQFGQAVRVADVVGGARPDVAVGAPFRRVTGSTFNAGVVSVFALHPGPVVTETVFENPYPTTNWGEFGNALAATDWNGDGLDDLVVASIFNHAQGVDHAGQVFVLGHVAEGAPAQFLATLDNPYAGNELGAAPCVSERYGMSLDAGDLDGDGFGEVLVGANRDDHSGVCEAGRGSLFSGAHPGTTVGFVHPHPVNFDLMAYRVRLGDVVGGPELDVIVGAVSTGQPQSTFVWDGAKVLGAGGFPTDPGPHDAVWHARPGHGGHHNGGISAGQLDRSGRDELIFGDYDAGLGGLPNVGRVFVTWWP